MFKISCFADEISPDLNEQINIMKKNDVKFVELRSVWNKNVLDLSPDELDKIKEGFFSNGIRVSSIGSPIGKVNIGEDFAKELDRFERAVEIALKMESRYIRIFSFYMSKDKTDYVSKDRAELYGGIVIDRLKQMLDFSIKHNLILLHENEADIYGETSGRCLKLFNSLHSNSFRAVFDPSNFVVAGEDVLEESFSRLKEHIEYIHVKDSLKGTGEIVVAGCGDGRIKYIFNELRCKDGMFVSLEPHLANAGKYRGFSGPELFVKDLEALRDILQELEIKYI